MILQIIVVLHIHAFYNMYNGAVDNIYTSSLDTR